MSKYKNSSCSKYDSCYSKSKDSCCSASRCCSYDPIIGSQIKLREDNEYVTIDIKTFKQILSDIENLKMKLKI